MKMKNIRHIAIAAVLAAGLVGCEMAGELLEDTRTVELGGAEFADVKLDIGVGELRVHGGARNLMEGYFRYNIDHWKPEIDYRISGSRGILTVKQGKSHRMTTGRKKNKWEVGLNDDIPINLTIDHGVGQGRIDLTRVTLKSVDIDMGVGDLTVDFSGDKTQSLDVVVDCGIGSTTLYLPQQIGVRARIDRGIGSIDARGFNKRGGVYTNDAYGRSDVTIDIDIDAGIGSVELRLK